MFSCKIVCSMRYNSYSFLLQSNHFLSNIIYKHHQACIQKSYVGVKEHMI